MKTFQKYNIRSEPHGDNSYKRDDRGRLIGHIGFVFNIKTKSAEKAMDEIKSIVKFIYGVMQTYADSGVAGSSVLDYLETGQNTMGLYKYFTQSSGVPEHDLTKVERQLETDLKRFFQKSPQFEEGFHLDTFLPDYGIRKLLEEHIECNSWKDARIGVRKACYKDKYKTEMLPEWGKIEKQYLKK